MSNSSASGQTPVKRLILIIDNHPLVRRGLTALIDNEPDLSVCAEAATCREGLEAIAASRPDLVITDLSFGEGDGLAMVKDIRSRYQDLPVLVLTMHDAPVYARRAFRAGASGYVTKQEMSEKVVIAIRRVLNGERYESPKTKA